MALAVTEHWKTEEQIKHYNLANYDLASCYCREENLHGGSAIYVRNGTLWKARSDLTKYSEKFIFECAAIEFSINNIKVVVLSVYRSPSSDVNIFLSKIENILSRLAAENVLLFLAGDFNIDIKRSNNDPANFLSLLASFNVTPSISEYTRISGTAKSCIDNIFSNCNTITPRILHTHISDHTGQKVSFSVPGKKPYNIINCRVFNFEGKQRFNQLLAEESWRNVFDTEESDINCQWETFTNLFFSAFNSCFPLKNVRPTNKDRSYYNSPAVVAIKQELDVLLVLSRADERYKDAYNKCKCRYNIVLQESKKKYYADKILSGNNRSRSTWQVVNELKGKNQSQKDFGIPGDPQVVSNFVNQFMVEAAPKLVSKLPKNNSAQAQAITYNFNSMFLTPVTTSEILEIIQKLKDKKSSGFDEISTNLIKSCAEQIASPLCYIINNSFKEGIFPTNLKLAVVKPLYKKGDPTMPESYRPISLLSSFSKIFEKAMCVRLVSFFEKFKLINERQHGFLAGKSINSAVFDFVNEIVDHIENKKVAMGAFLDLSKAFDCLNHEILLNKLESYGVRGLALRWVKSYLKGRTQRVVIQRDGHNYYSDDKPLEVGVPQGSILGPFLFICYINDLDGAVVDRNVSIVKFADDTNILIGEATVKRTLDVCENSLVSAQNWFNLNGLLLNPSKSNFVIFRTKQSRLLYPENASLLSQVVPISTDTKFLGIYIDCHLTWEREVDYVLNKLNSCCYMLRTLKNYLDLRTLFITYHANFNSIMKFGVLFWGGSVNASRVFILQKRALRIMLGMSWRESCRGIFRSHGLLTLAGLHIYECVTFLYNNKHLFQNHLPIHTHNTRSFNYNIPSHKLTLYEHGPLYLCIKYYHCLPLPMRQIQTAIAFKKSVKKFLIELEPYSVTDFLTCECLNVTK